MTGYFIVNFHPFTMTHLLQAKSVIKTPFEPSDKDDFCFLLKKKKKETKNKKFYLSLLVCISNEIVLNFKGEIIILNLH